MTFIYILAALILAAYIQSRLAKSRKKSKQNLLDGLTDFTATDKVFLKDGKYALALDKDRKKFCVVLPGSSPMVFDRSQLLQIEVDIDSDTKLKGATTGAIAGGVVGGTTGAALGALLNSSVKTKVKGISLNIVTDTSSGMQIQFLDFDTLDVKHPYVDEAYKKANHWKLKIESL